MVLQGASEQKLKGRQRLDSVELVGMVLLNCICNTIRWCDNEMMRRARAFRGNREQWTETRPAAALGGTIKGSLTNWRNRMTGKLNVKCLRLCHCLPQLVFIYHEEPSGVAVLVGHCESGTI